MNKTPGRTLYDLINPQDGGIRPASWDEVDEDYHEHYAKCEDAIRNAILEEAAKKMENSHDIIAEIGRVVEIIAVEGIPGPRDLDVAVDAIVVTFRDAIRALKHGD